MRAILLIMLLSACSTSPKLPEKTLVPVPVACIESAPAKPAIMADAEILKLQDYALVLSIWKERLILKDYAAVLESALQSCLP